MSEFKIYHRDAVEKRLINMAKLKSEGAKALHAEVFKGVPATAVGVIVFSKKEAGVIFLSEFKDEPISHFRNIDTSEQYDALAGAIYNIPPANVLPWAKIPLDKFKAVVTRIPSEVGKRAQRIAQSTTLKECSEMLVLSGKGLIALSPKHIIGKIENPDVSRLCMVVIKGGKIE